MKKLILTVAFLIVVTAAPQARAAAHGPAGCGLGAVLFKGQSGLVMNVLAATFNGTSANQTFGMSTGTLGCEDAATAKVAGAAFIEGNKFALANDIARGGGETLDAYLALINAEAADRAQLQQNYRQIFQAQSADAIHEKIVSLVQA